MPSLASSDVFLLQQHRGTAAANSLSLRGSSAAAVAASSDSLSRMSTISDIDVASGLAQQSGTKSGGQVGAPSFHVQLFMVIAATNLTNMAMEELIATSKDLAIVLWNMLVVVSDQ